jgi:phosphate butyryltransferase
MTTSVQDTPKLLCDIKGNIMITSFEDASRVAKEKGPKKLAVLAPEDKEFMLAVMQSWQRGYIEPVLIGHAEIMEQMAEMIGFDISRFEKIIEKDRQAIADLGIDMLFSGKVDVASKGQIPTSYIYRSIIRAEARAASGMTLSVISLWDIPGLDHLVAFTDSGVNISPDYKKKAEILKNAIFLSRLFGYAKPKIAVLSGQRALGGTLASFRDHEVLKQAAESGDFGECEIIDATSFTGIFLGPKGRLVDYSNIDITRMPHILLVPNLDTGNILCKLDFLIEVTRCSLAVTTAGAVCIPARSDFSDSIVGQIAMGVVVADRMKNS